MLKWSLAVVAALSLAAVAVRAADPAAKAPAPAAKTAPAARTADNADARAAIAKKFPGISPADVRVSPMPGIYEVQLGADTAYVSSDGRYLIAGDMYEVESRTNITEASRSDVRSKAIAKLDERDMIIFGPASAKHTITIFTDVECGYCRKLHSEVEQLNKLGVRVRYLAYPRAGPDTDDWRKMEAVWCSKDRNAAITQAKQGTAVKTPACNTAPVARQFALGESLGVRGTPAIFTNRGDYIGGYLPPDKLVKELNDLESASKKTAALN